MSKILFAGVSLSIAVLTLIAPLASATSTATFVPPYTHGTTIVGTAFPSKGGGCTAETHSTSAHAGADLSTGLIQIQAVASVQGQCAVRPLFVAALAKAGFRSPIFTVSTSGTHSVSFHWLLDWSAHANSSGGTSSFASGHLFGFIWDATALAVVSGSSHSFEFASVKDGTSNTVEDFHHSLLTSGSLIVGHDYRLETFAQVEAGASVFGAGSSAAKITMAFGGEFGLVSSMVVA